MGLFKWILRILMVVVLLVVVAGIAGAVWYNGDGKVQADVKKTDCAAGQVTVKVRYLGLTKAIPIDATQCLVVASSKYVEYHVKSHRTVLFTIEGGACTWDTAIPGPCPGSPRP